MSEMLDCVCVARIFTELDLRGAYHLIRIKRGDEYKMAPWTRYSQSEYRVISFGPTNTPATLQSCIDDFLRPSIEDFGVYYLDYLLIYSTNETQHEEHMRQVLQRLWEFSFYCNAEKCQFRGLEVDFLGCVITPAGVGMESDQITTIDDWQTPKSVGDVQVLLGFKNFYLRFILKYAKVSLPQPE